MAKRYKHTSNKQQRKPNPATSSDWDKLVEDPTLTHAWTQLAKAVSFAEHASEEQTRMAGTPVPIDLRNAARILDQHPQLVKYLDGIREREVARQEAMTRPDIMLSSPTGSVRGDPSFGGVGQWTSTGLNKNNPIGVRNPRQLREWADTNEWVNSACNFLAEKVGRADIAVLPTDERKKYDRKVMKDMQLMLDQPNELKDNWPMLVGMFVRDLLTLGQGVFTKDMTLETRIPVGFYAEDAADIKIYPAWSGDPKEPRYLYQEGTVSGVVRKVPLRNDEAIVVCYMPASYRFGQGPVQTLAMTIQADLNATKAAMHLVDFKPPPHAVQIPGITDAQLKALRANYENEVQGRREILFLGGPNPAHFFPLVFSARDNQWLEWQVYLARKICACFGISPQDIGLTFDINRATAEVQQEVSESKGFIPLLLMIEDYLNREFLDDFAPKLPNQRSNRQALNLRVVFPEISEAARMLHTQKSADLATKMMAGLPTATLNQILMMRGEEPVDGGNTYWVMTKDGPMPWLSYDGEYGDWTSSTTTGGELGAQDAGGGISSDDSADDDAGSSPGTGENEVSQNATTEATASTSDTGSSDSSSGGNSGTASSQKRLKSASKDEDDDEEEGHTGVMVAFFLDAKSAKKLAIPDGEPAEDLHVTLAFLGDKSELTVDVTKLKKELAGFASEAIPLKGTIGGLGRFAPSDSSDGKAPIIALVNVPGLQTWRAALVKRLESLGVKVANDFDFTPHITLAYVDADAPMPVDEVPELDLEFDALWLAVGDDRTSFTIGDEQYPQEKRQTKRYTTHMQRALDIRKPGTAWNPASSMLQRAVSMRRVPEHIVQAYKRPDEEEEARKQVAKAVKRVFEDAAKRGKEKAG